MKKFLLLISAAFALTANVAEAETELKVNLWSGEMAGSWSGTKFASASLPSLSEGDELRVTVTAIGDADNWPQVVLRQYDYSEFTTALSYELWDATAPCTAVFTLTQEAIDEITSSGGLIVCGDGYTMTSIDIYSSTMVYGDEDTIWEGSWQCSNWDGNQDLAWNAYDWSGVSAGDIIKFYVEFADETLSWACLSPRRGSGWGNLSVSQFNFNPSAGPTSVLFTLTEDDVNNLQNNYGLVVTGLDFTLLKITLLHAIEPVTVTGTVYDYTYVAEPEVFADGATVTFTSGDHKYSTTSGDDGTYSLEILRSDLEYSAKAEYYHYRTGKKNSVSDLTKAVDFKIYELDYDEITITQVPDRTYGYTTFCELEWDIEIPEGVEARVYGVDADNLTLNSTLVEGGVIPAGVAVVLYTETPGDYEMWIAAEDAESSLKSELLSKSDMNGHTDEGAGTVARDETTAGYYFYDLQYNPEKGVGFYWGAADGGPFRTSGSYKGWLYLKQEVAAKVSGFSFEQGAVTGISVVGIDTAANKGIYTVSGQQLKKASKPGLYIIDGKKTVVK